MRISSTLHWQIASIMLYHKRLISCYIRSLGVTAYGIDMVCSILTNMLQTHSSQVENLNMGDLFVSCPKKCLAFLKSSNSLERHALLVHTSSSEMTYLVFDFLLEF